MSKSLSKPEPQQNSFASLKGQVAVVTGASSGIGEAIAVALARVGVRVSLLARRDERLQQLKMRLIEEGCPEPLIFKADVSESQQVKDAIQQTIEKFGQIDILVNNAGVMYLGTVDGAVTEDWKRMFDINVIGLMYCTHAVLPAMKSRKTGHVINISSVSGRVVTSRSAVYSETKFAVNAFSEGLRQEVCKDGIRVTAIEPGAVLTELTNHIPDEATKKAVKDWVSNMAALKSEDIANAILYVASQPQWVNVNELLIRPTDQVM
jgi:NADP-dependent 3-hydroxy acid dehydrogenase YdfG